MTAPSGATGPGYTVTTADLRTHATVLNEIAGMLGQALGAAQQVALGTKAYGQIPVSAAFSALVTAVASPGIAALTQAQSTLSTINGSIGNTATNYDNVEHNNTGRFSGGAQ